ncbi:MAG: hypothetical protein A2452_07860 [Candidatus Firestonebacteria bacterium RIFOXYC2_FULL_39_67]|nr:MAG: hypothetical protein A2536_08205 [Candidatus Firestonebacteria bacterium RIFOXYD2_FULL_39_29]OGF54473.1 MAG: hypothetical protein A2497_07385 [Candidatus Firestonebacteria bacterium RifOxyC12_full_39_7]OGF56757.1 MAG: hypothetical protein A2452_07860 [Candidatus Firestonebacteria bacterium RIFOXYC2_FULL_39_67]
MKRIKLSKKEYYDKMYACWLGKNIGGTFGAPYECKKYLNSLDFYTPVPNGSAPNDDLDLQLVWLKLLEDKKGIPEIEDFAEYWKKYTSIYPWDEYGFCARNLDRGLLPPISGCFENFYIDNMGSPIRSEIWACLFPGNPEVAAEMAWKDSVMDHTGGEGLYGEMFWAAVESAAFVEKDPKTLINIGLAMIPCYSEISRVIRDAVWCFENKIVWADARNRIVEAYGNNHPCHAVPNHGFTILGWLYGKDFGDKLCKAVNCGYDTDCTGATLGSLLGIIGGRKAIPEKWLKPIGENIILHVFTGKFNSPKTIKELSGRMLKLAEKYEQYSDTVEFGSKTVLPKEVLSLLFRNEKAREILLTDPLSSIVVREGLKIILHYNGDPVLLPEITKTVEISVLKNSLPVNAAVNLTAPKGWEVKDKEMSSLNKKAFSITAGKVKARNTITAEVSYSGKTIAANFMMFGPEEAKGWEITANVKKCQKCDARIEKCLCK